MRGATRPNVPFKPNLFLSHQPVKYHLGLEGEKKKKKKNLSPLRASGLVSSHRNTLVLAWDSTSNL